MSSSECPYSRQAANRPSSRLCRKRTLFWTDVVGRDRPRISTFAPLVDSVMGVAHRSLLQPSFTLKVKPVGAIDADKNVKLRLQARSQRLCLANANVVACLSSKRPRPRCELRHLAIGFRALIKGCYVEQPLLMAASGEI